jgi:hypothetical protein
MGGLSDDQRTRILGMNAARFFDFDVDRLLAYRSAATAQA